MMPRVASGNRNQKEKDSTRNDAKRNKISYVFLFKTHKIGKLYF